MSDNLNFHFKRPEQSTGYLLWQITMLWQRQMNRALTDLGLTHTQFVILAALGWLTKENEEVTQVEIANHSKTDRMMVSKIIANLQQRKIIKRQEHSTDTRAKCVSLTDKGKTLLNNALKIVEKTDKQFFLPLSIKATGFNNSLLQLLNNQGG